MDAAVRDQPSPRPGVARAVLPTVLPTVRTAASLVAVGVATAVGVGFAAQRVVDRAVRLLPSRSCGREVEVGTTTVHVELWGNDAPGAPTVVAESGVGGTSADWQPVAELLDDRIRLVAVDRPGLGRSEPGDPPTATDAVARVEALRDALGIDGPVVLAGWSMGGLLALGVAALRPDLVAGLVLVEPSHPDEARRFHDPALRPVGRLMWRAVAFGSRFGGAAVVGIPSRHAYLRWSRNGRPDRPRGEPRWQMPTFATTDAGQALAREMIAFPEVCDEVGRLHGAHRREGRDLACVPCVLLTASRRRGADDAAAWAEMHDDLATWVPGTELSVVEDSGHDMPADRPDVVAEAIEHVLRLIPVDLPDGGPATLPPVLSPR